jgi:hypothetical protein
MDPYMMPMMQSSQMSQVSQSSSQGYSMKYIGICVCVLVLVIGAVFMMRKPSSSSPSTSQTSPSTSQTSPPTSQQRISSGGGGDDDEEEGERKWVSDPPESKLANFSFESYTKKLHVPDKTGKLVRKPAGNPPYKLVGCNSTGAYAIRWNGRYLAVREPNKVIWVEEKEEPATCFKIVPGHCGSGEKYIMLRSVANKMFLRADGPTNVLVCKDIPTGRTAASYCWKLNPEFSGKQPCGQIYSYDLGRVIDVPCNVVSVPPTTGTSCKTVTPGYHATCCMKRGATHDPYCTSIIFPKVVGQPLQQALLYIRTRRPDLSLKPCPIPCTLKAIPIQNPKLVVVPYDPRSNVVTSIPYVLI